MGIDILKVSLEFSPKLGIRSLPQLSKHKESNVAGLYIIGDLADAPIIKVALNQGHDVAEHVLETIGGPGKGEDEVLDVIVIGAGPAGIGAALALQDAGARYVLLEREKPFNTIQNFPKAKLIFSEPKSFENKGNFWFEDAQKEELIDRWAEALDERELVLHQPEEVLDVVRKGGLFTVTTKVGKDGMDPGHHLDGVTFDGAGGAHNRYRAKRVILAIGRRGSVNKLGIPGEKLQKVTYALKDPDDHTGRKVLIVGGGDSAVEAAVACADAGADVTIAYRGDAFHRAKLKNQQTLQVAIDKGLVKAEMGATPTAVTEDLVTLKRGGESFDLPNDDMLVFIGTKLPSGFLKKLGIRMEGEMDWLRIVWISGFALLTYLLYVLKQKKDFFPFGEGDPFSGVPAALNVDLGFRTVEAGFWGTVLYSVVILVFGIRAYRKYPMKLHKNRYLQLIGFQLVFLFGIPELIAPFIIERPWRMYGISVPWPLWTGSLVDGPGWGTETSVALGWMAAGAIVAFVVVPLYVRRNGLRFCSYLCGCGGLAETLGDYWRHLAPRGKTAQQMEIFGKLILLAAVPVTLMTINDLWRFVENDALFSTSAFAAHWYALMVDFWLAAVLGVAFYPYLGNRFWCRFFCPLRAFMELLSKWFGKMAIDSNDKCIGCGECTRYCQMGIDVQRFAQRQETFHNGNSACIHCGICIQVCPMEVLSLADRRFGS
jgi:thioredoxin reductase/NAD-dependent dihydropyrimidine dehydrogenase PreA subunit